MAKFNSPLTVIEPSQKSKDVSLRLIEMDPHGSVDSGFESLRFGNGFMNNSNRKAATTNTEDGAIVIEFRN